MTTKSDIDLFLTELSEYKGKPIQRYKKFIGFSKATHRNSIMAEEAYSQIILKLYEILPDPLTEAYCYTAIKNFSWLGNKENRYQKKHMMVGTFWESTTNALDIFELKQEAEDQTCSSDFVTFYGQELWKEGKYTHEQIRRLESLRVVSQRLPLWARELYDLTYIQGKTYREIAKLKKIPLGSVSSLQKTLKKMIVDHLTGLNGDEIIY